MMNDKVHSILFLSYISMEEIQPLKAPFILIHALEHQFNGPLEDNSVLGG